MYKTLLFAVLLTTLAFLGHNHSFSGEYERLDGLVAKTQNEPSETNRKELHEYVQANMDLALAYFDVMRVYDEESSLGVAHHILHSYCSQATPYQLQALVKRLMESADIAKRQVFFSWFWHPGPPTDFDKRFANACIDYLRKVPHVRDDIVSALFQYLGFGCDFYVSGRSPALMTWMRQQAANGRGLQKFYAHQVIMAMFPWNKNLLAEAQKTLASTADNKSGAVEGALDGLGLRLKLCVEDQHGHKASEEDKERLIPQADAVALGKAAVPQASWIISLNQPDWALKEARPKRCCELLFYLGVLNKNNADGEKLLAAFFAEAPMDEVVKTMVDCWLSARQAFPEIATKHGRQIFQRLGKHDTFVFAGLMDFINAYFACPDIPDAEKAACRLLLEQALGLAPAEKTDK